MSDDNQNNRKMWQKVTEDKMLRDIKSRQKEYVGPGLPMETHTEGNSSSSNEYSALSGGFLLSTISIPYSTNGPDDASSQKSQGLDPEQTERLKEQIKKLRENAEKYGDLDPDKPDDPQGPKDDGQHFDTLG